MRSANSLLLVIALFLSLAVLVVVFPMTAFLVTAIFILALGIALAMIGKEWAHSTLYSFALVASVIAAMYLGQAVAGNVGAITFILLDIVIFIGATNWLQNNQISVPGDRVLIMSRYQGKVQYVSTTSAIPRLPFERKLALIPLYSLGTSIRVENVETTSMRKFKAITVGVGYQVRKGEALTLFKNLPKHDGVIAAVKASFAKDQDSSPLNPLYWDKLIARYIEGMIVLKLRDLIYERVPFPGDIDKEVENGTQKSRHRKLIERDIQTSLNEAVRDWGLDILGVGIESVEIDPELLKDRAKFEAMTNKFAADRLESVGKAHAENYSYMISELITTLKERNVELSDELIRKIVSITLEEMAEQRRREEAAQVLQALQK